MTPEYAQLLYELQKIDSGIDQRRTLLAETDDGSGAKAELEAAQAELERLREELGQKQARQRKLQLDLETIEAERDEKTSRAYGGTVSDPKELTALDQKIGELSRNVERHEDMILELLDEIDTVEGQVQAQEEDVRRLRESYESVTENYRRTTSRAREEIGDLQRRREEIVPALNDGLVTEYEHLRERLGGVAVAAMRDGRCDVCNVAVPRAQQLAVQRAAAIVKCESCRRILVVPQEE